MHDTDNDGMITLEEYRHVSLVSAVWRIPYWFTVNKYADILTLEAFGPAGEMENKGG